MADPCDNVSVGVSVSDTPVQGVSTVVSVSARAVDEQAISVVTFVSRSVSVSDARTDAFGILVSDTVGVGDARVQPLSAVQFVTDRALIREFVPPLMSNTVSDTFRATDAMTHSIVALAADRVRAQDVVDQAQTFTALVSRTARVTDVARQFIAEFVVRSARATDVAAGTLRVTDLIARTVRATDATPVAQTLGQTVVDRARAGDAQAQTLYAVQMVVDDAFAGGEAIFDSGVAWTAMLDSWGMSQWTNLPGDSIGVKDGKFLIGGDGLYVESEPTHEATIDLGISDMGVPQLKRLSYAYWHGMVNGVVMVLVGDHDGGEEQLWPYEFERESGSQWEPMRARLGRGHRARDFRVEIQPSGTFELGELRILHDATSRKV